MSKTQRMERGALGHTQIARVAYPTVTRRRWSGATRSLPRKALGIPIHSTERPLNSKLNALPVPVMRVHRIIKKLAMENKSSAQRLQSSWWASSDWTRMMIHGWSNRSRLVVRKTSLEEGTDLILKMCSNSLRIFSAKISISLKSLNSARMCTTKKNAKIFLGTRMMR